MSGATHDLSKLCPPLTPLRFVHERGFRSGIFNLGVLGGINLAQPIGETSLPPFQGFWTDIDYQRVRLFSMEAIIFVSMRWVAHLQFA